MSEQLILKNGNSAITVNTGGTYNLTAPGIELSNCRCRVEIDGLDMPLNWHCRENSAQKLTFRAANSAGQWQLEFAQCFNNSNLPGIKTRLSGCLTRAFREIKINQLDTRGVTATHLLMQGIAMGSTNSVVFPCGEPRKITGSYITMLSCGDDHLQISSPARQKILTEFNCDCNREFIGELTAVNHLLHSDATDIDTDWIEFFGGRDPFQMMVDWADANTEVQKDFSDMIKPGWNSWDYYRWTITEDEVLENAEFIAKDPVLSQHIKRIIVDDGWQYCYGEWEANPLFPHGMKYLADKLTKLGFEPGLWIAPTIVEPHCRIGQLERDMLAMSEGGQPCLCYSCMERFGFVLDPTVAKVQKHLYDLFDRYAGMGYKYFKLDFMGSTLAARRFHDQTVQRSEIARLIVKPIYEAVHGRAAILGCNYNFNAGNKYVDAVRVGGDIHSTWRGIKHNVISVAGRFFSNKRWWVNDPDFALCRAFDTAADPDLNRLKCCWVYCHADSEYKELFDFSLVDIKKTQSELLLSIVLMAAGAVNLSDKLTRLNADGLELARKVVSAESGETGIPLDLFSSEQPSLWLQKLSASHRVLLVNWADEPRELTFDLKKYGLDGKNATDFWHGDAIAVKGGAITRVLPPRSCLLAVIA